MLRNIAIAATAALVWIALCGATLADIVPSAAETVRPSGLAPQAIQRAEDANEAKRNSAKQESGAQSSPITVNVSVGGDLQTHPRQDHDESDNKSAEPVRWTDVVIALFTAGIFCVTAALAIYTGMLWRSTSDLVKQSEKHSERELRAYVGIRQNPTRNMQSVPTTTIYIYFKNHGKTPARNVRFLFNGPAVFDHEETAVFPPPVDLSLARTLMQPGMRHTFFKEVSTEPIREHWDALRAGQRFVFIWGKIEYTDVFDKSHWTTFRLGLPGGMIAEGEWSDCRYGNDAN
jgi:hypothetical protein